jgi:flavodoxin
MDLLAGAVSWVSGGLSRLAGAVAGAPAALPGRLPVRIVYATTGGTARRYAEALRKELFAMGLSGFWFDVQLVDAGELTMDGVDALLEGGRDGATLFLLPTWSGGVPPDSGRLLADAVNDQATDFRVSKDALSHLRYAVFGLGSSAYEHAGNWARAGRELDANLRALSAVPLADLGVGDESSDQEAAFREWREGELYPALCELYAQLHGGGGGGGEDEGAEESGEGDDGDAGAAVAACGGSARAGSDAACCGGSAASDCGCKEGAAAAGTAAAAAAPPGEGGAGAYPVNRREWRKLGIGYGEGQKLSLRQWRRQQRAEAEERRQEAEAAARAAARKEKARLEAEAAAAASAAAAGASNDVDDDGLTEEDRVNDRFISRGDGDGGDDDEDVATARRKAAAALGDEGVGDVEDLGAAMAAAKADAARTAAAAAAGKPPPEMITPMQRRVLTKEGYQLIGGHSAVKLCRWTKAQLRGRGGCYKHTG